MKTKITDNQKELFVVVDKNDKIVGYKTRAKCHSDKNLIHRATGIIIFNDHGEVLLQKRSKSKDFYPGYFSVSASGHVNKGETYKQAAKREMLEEIGVKAKITLVAKFIYKAKKETEINSLFTASHNGPFNPNQDEVELVKFVAIRDLKKLDKIEPYAIQCLQTAKLL